MRPSGILNSVKLQLTVGMIGDNQEMTTKGFLMKKRTFRRERLCEILEILRRLRGLSIR